MYSQANRPIGDVVQELKLEAKDFVATRFDLLKRELQEKSKSWKAGIPLLAGAAFCGLTCFAVLNFAALALLRGLFDGSAYAWCFAALILAAVYVLAGGALYWIGMHELKVAGVVPTRTLRVLKQDQVWLQNEARSQV